MSRATSVALLTVLSCALVLLAQGCASRAAAAGETPQAVGGPIRIRYAVYTSGQNLELVNPARSDRTELYSTTRKLEDAGTKVSTDEVLQETLRYFDEHGFGAKAVAGPAPRDGGNGAYSQALEVETPSRHVHMVLHRGLDEADRRRFLTCAKAFAEVYNSTYQLQSVDRAPEWETNPRPAAKPSSGGR
jgi:hypothetical protein